ncbi:hypothetical protein JHK82_031699 [Glycine max]|nr:hypothetical protein JHK86_031793 [Glycine max]KAG5124962.1 hypothetical protein JHK82_031699 [Glycine max]KAG5146391.1 hypothetical protein JHK84_031934 [Glycine max]
MAITGFSFDMASERELFARASNAEWVEQDEEELQMVALLRLSMQKHVNTTLVRKLSLDMSNRGGSSPGKKNKVKIDVRKLNRFHRERVVKDALATNEQDNYKLLSAIKEHFDKWVQELCQLWSVTREMPLRCIPVGLDVPSIKVRYKNLTIGADVKMGSRALPTLISYTRDAFEGMITGMGIGRPQRHSLTILNNISGVVKPGR